MKETEKEREYWAKRKRILGEKKECKRGRGGRKREGASDKH